jgi:thiamine-phosphate pyrophosphorylase
LILPPFYPILDLITLARSGVRPETVAEAIIEAGCRLLQFRHKGHFDRETFETLKRVGALCGGATLIVDDRADIAALLGIGVHLGQQDLEPADARKILGSSGVIGFSTHNEAQLRAGDREPVDYLALGPIFATGSKANPDPVVGLDELRRLRQLTTKPLVAIGGIRLADAAAVRAAGADSIAVIGDLLPEEIGKLSIRARVEEWLRLVL